MKSLTEADEAFHAGFGRPAELQVLAPGRINLIGEHTDYNDGLVLPVATHRGAVFTTAANEAGALRFRSDAFPDDMVSIAIDALADARSSGHWSDYVIGTARELTECVREPIGVDIHIASDLPHGGGLSSSAAITVGTATALDAHWKLGLSPVEIARYAQAAENRFVGTRCGILDPFAIAMGEAGHALYVDCGSLAYESIPFPVATHTIIVAHTGIRRELAASAYNERRSECEQAARRLSGAGPERTLSAFTAADLEPLATDSLLLARARHIVTENDRVRQAAAALGAGNIARFGELLLESHASLRSDYEVSCEELDVMVEESMTLGAAGAKMTGAGFGGAAVAIVSRELADGFVRKLADRYRVRTGRRAEIFPCNPADGARRLDHSDKRR